MKHPEPNLPSFASVLNEGQHPLRASARRYSQVLRYQPYARPSNTQSRRNTLMTTIDERTYDYDYGEDFFLPSASSSGQTNSVTLGLHQALNARHEGQVVEGKPGIRIRLVTLVVDLAFLVVRKLRPARGADM